MLPFGGISPPYRTLLAPSRYWTNQRLPSRLPQSSIPTTSTMAVDAHEEAQKNTSTDPATQSDTIFPANLDIDPATNQPTNSSANRATNRPLHPGAKARSSPHSTQTTRDDRIRITTLRDAGLTYEQISKQLGLTAHQVQYAVKQPITPKKRSGRPATLSQEEVDRIIKWMTASEENRNTSWMKIPAILELDVGYYAVRNALRKAGFRRKAARGDPPTAIQHASEDVSQSYQQ